MSLASEHINKINSLKKEREEEIQLIAVSKKVSSEKILKFSCEHNHKDFGENYLNEFKIKKKELNTKNFVWHYLGQIQSKKIPQIFESFNYVHAVSERKHFEKFNELGSKSEIKPGLFLQIKFGNEPAKTGVTYDEALLLRDFLVSLDSIEFAGLMCVLPLGLTKNKQENYFLKMNQLKKEYLKFFPVCQLSMGMSDDYELAINSGANWIRLGRALFGERSILPTLSIKKKEIT